jgi:2-polyprenyl-3-methyl-5-hydroxy-6-metoxy-1,4-benzoquinol methylase
VAARTCNLSDDQKPKEDDMKKWVYELIYRFVPVDMIFGSTSKMENFVEVAIDGRIAPCKAITLGCGVGRETIYLAKKGFDVIGLDFSPTAIEKARRRAKREGVEIEFIVDDLTNLRHVEGTFDLVTDFGALNDLSQQSRDLYMENVLPLTFPGSHYLMFCFDRMLSPEEVTRRFEQHFTLKVLETRPEEFPGTLTLYLMTRM